MTAPEMCPGCGDPVGPPGGYDGLCWPCWSRTHPEPAKEKELAPAWLKFRQHVTEKLWSPERFGYVTSDSFIGKCPCCDGAVAVRFRGRCEDVDLCCHGAGCSEAAIAEAIGLGVKS